MVIVSVALIAGCHAKGTAPTANNAATTQASVHPEPADGPMSAEDNSDADEPPALANSGDQGPVLVCFGDSLTAGVRMGPGQSYPDDLQRDLNALGYKYRVVNQGVSGNTTKDGVARLGDVLKLKPEIAVVEFGGNDGLRGLPIAETEANLDQIVGTLQGTHIKVALAGITLPPDYGEDYIRRFDEIYSRIAKKYHVILLPFLLQNVYGRQGMIQSRDQIHPTAKGNEQVARNVLGLVRPLLKKK